MNHNQKKYVIFLPYRPTQGHPRLGLGGLTVFNHVTVDMRQLVEILHIMQEFGQISAGRTSLCHSKI